MYRYDLSLSRYNFSLALCFSTISLSVRLSVCLALCSSVSLCLCRFFWLAPPATPSLGLFLSPTEPPFTFLHAWRRSLHDPHSAGAFRPVPLQLFLSLWLSLCAFLCHSARSSVCPYLSRPIRRSSPLLSRRSLQTGPDFVEAIVGRAR